MLRRSASTRSFLNSTVSNWDIKSHGVSHLAIVMDGNRRFAKKNEKIKAVNTSQINELCTKILHNPVKGILSPDNSTILHKLDMLKQLIRYTALDGHRIGAEKVESLILQCVNAGISMLTVYAFSTENWQRSHHEVQVLLSILFEVFYKFERFAEKYGVFIRFITTDCSHIPESLMELMKIIEIKSRVFRPRNLTLNICLSYGGLTEISSACSTIMISRFKQNDCSPVSVDEIKRLMLRSVTQPLYEDEDINVFLKNNIEPDLIIRTGGDYRISNFLIFESAYSELYFSKKTWPEFDEKDLHHALHEYSKRERRHGR